MCSSHLEDGCIKQHIIALFKSVTTLCGTDNISQYISHIQTEDRMLRWFSWYSMKCYLTMKEVAHMCRWWESLTHKLVQNLSKVASVNNMSHHHEQRIHVKPARTSATLHRLEAILGNIERGLVSRRLQPRGGGGREGGREFEAWRQWKRGLSCGIVWNF